MINYLKEGLLNNKWIKRDYLKKIQRGEIMARDYKSEARSATERKFKGKDSSRWTPAREAYQQAYEAVSAGYDATPEQRKEVERLTGWGTEHHYKGPVSVAAQQKYFRNVFRRKGVPNRSSPEAIKMEAYADALLNKGKTPEVILKGVQIYEAMGKPNQAKKRLKDAYHRLKGEGTFDVGRPYLSDGASTSIAMDRAKAMDMIEARLGFQGGHRSKLEKRLEPYRAQTNGPLYGSFVIPAAVGLLGIFLLSGNITGNVIASGVSQTSSNILGAVLTVIGIVGVAFFLKR